MTDAFAPTAIRSIGDLLHATVAVSVSQMDMSVSSLEASVSSEKKRKNSRRKRSRRGSTDRVRSRLRSLSESEISKGRWDSQEPREAEAHSSLSPPRRKQSNPDLFGLHDDDEEEPVPQTTKNYGSAPRTLGRFMPDLQCNCSHHNKDLAPHRISLASSPGGVSALSPRLPLRSLSSDEDLLGNDGDDKNTVHEQAPPLPNFVRRKSEDTFEAPSLPVRKESAMDLMWDMSESLENSVGLELDCQHQA